MRNLPTIKPSQFYGAIQVDSYDFNGSILSVKIVNDCEELLIGDNAKGNCLTKLVGKIVFAKGVVIEEPGLKYFEIEEFKEVSEKLYEKKKRSSIR